MRVKKGKFYNKKDISKLTGILIENAISHCNDNGNIDIKLYKEKKHIILEVSNTGDIIPKDDLDKIFERFYKSDKSHNRNNNHYGLGLAIAKQIVTNHDGDINVTSSNNLTCFKIIF